jgi:uncharacterized membrane protein
LCGSSSASPASARSFVTSRPCGTKCFPRPLDLFIFIGVCELLGGVGLILPAMTEVKPKLTPLTAFT